MHSPVFATAKQADGSYDFENIFRYSKELVSSVDYAIANLETTFGGPKHPHQPNMAFSCPDELAKNAKVSAKTKVAPASENKGSLVIKEGDDVKAPDPAQPLAEGVLL
jgi:hypothetical protein